MYADFPDCLPRYAWLLDQGDNAFDCAGTCKACGEHVARDARTTHLEGHRKALDAMRAKARRDALARAQAAKQLQREA